MTRGNQNNDENKVQSEHEVLPAGNTDITVVRVDNHGARYWEILQFNIEWLKFSETKAGVILTVCGVLLTMAYTNATAIFQSMENSNVIIFLIFLYGGLTLGSIGFSFACLNPNLKNKEIDSMIYFGHISKKHKKYKDYKTYAQGILDNEDKFTDQITEQIYTISKLAWLKFVRVTWSLRLFILSLIILIMAILVHLISFLSK